MDDGFRLLLIYNKYDVIDNYILLCMLWSQSEAITDESSSPYAQLWSPLEISVGLELPIFM